MQANDPVKEKGVMDMPALNATKLVACMAAKKRAACRVTAKASLKAVAIFLLYSFPAIEKQSSSSRLRKQKFVKLVIGFVQRVAVPEETQKAEALLRKDPPAKTVAGAPNVMNDCMFIKILF